MPVETTTITYDGNISFVVTVNNSIPGTTYGVVVNAWPDGGGFSQLATTSTTIINITVSGSITTYPFDVYVSDEGAFFTADHIGCEVFMPGSTTPYSFPGTWTFDGIDTVTFTCSGSTAGETCVIETLDQSYGGSYTETVATGALQTFTHVIPVTPVVGDYFYARFYEIANPAPIYGYYIRSNELFPQLPFVETFESGLGDDWFPLLDSSGNGTDEDRITVSTEKACSPTHSIRCYTNNLEDSILGGAMYRVVLPNASFNTDYYTHTSFYCPSSIWPALWAADDSLEIRVLLLTTYADLDWGASGSNMKLAGQLTATSSSTGVFRVQGLNCPVLEDAWNHFQVMHNFSDAGAGPSRALTSNFWINGVEKGPFAGNYYAYEEGVLRLGCAIGSFSSDYIGGPVGHYYQDNCIFDTTYIEAPTCSGPGQLASMWWSQSG